MYYGDSGAKVVSFHEKPKRESVRKLATVRIYLLRGEVPSRCKGQSIKEYRLGGERN